MLIKELINIDVRTMIAILFWINIAAVLLNAVYRLTADRAVIRPMRNVTLSKGFQALGFFLIFYRGSIPDILSVNIGNSCLFVGFYAEALTIFEMLEMKAKKNSIMMSAILIFALVIFNICESVVSDSNIRVASASVCVFIIMFAPSVSMIAEVKVSTFKRAVGFLYLIYTALLLPRIFVAFIQTDMTVFTNNFIQTGTFLSLILVDTLGNCVFLIVLNENAYKATKQLATMDYLTMLPNRYSFLERAEKMIEAHKLSREPVAVVFFDLDHFKDYNDKYGHSFGDRILIRFAELLKSNLRECDLSCRYGGEEFIVVLGKTSCASGVTVANRILDELSRIEIDGVNGFTLSAGIACGVPSRDDDIMRYINSSDTMMYKAKENGRNRIESTSLNKQ